MNYPPPQLIFTHNGQRLILTECKRQPGGGHGGCHFEATLGGVRVYVKVAENYIPDSDNALSGEAEDFFFRLLQSGTFGGYPDEVIHPLHLIVISNDENDAATQVFLAQCRKRNNTRNNSVYIIVMPFGDPVADGTETAAAEDSLWRSAFGQFFQSPTMTFDVFRSKLDRKTANSVFINGKLKLIDFNTWSNLCSKLSDGQRGHIAAFIPPKYYLCCSCQEAADVKCMLSGCLHHLCSKIGCVLDPQCTKCPNIACHHCGAYCQGGCGEFICRDCRPEHNNCVSRDADTSHVSSESE